MTHRNYIALAFALLLLVNAHPRTASAQSDEELNLDDITIVETLPAETQLDGGVDIDLGQADVTARRSLIAMLDDTRAMTVIDAGSFAGAQSLGEVLERVPGLDVRSIGGTGQLSTAQLRGARANQVLVLVNGSPLSTGGTADLSALPLGSIERVEVVRGPEAARFGPGALGGVINLITLSPDIHDPAACPEMLQNIEIRTGGHDTYEFAFSQAGGDHAYHFSHSQSSNDYSFQRNNGLPAVRRNNDASQQDFWASWHRGDVSHRLGLSHMRRGVPGSAEFPTLHARLGRDSFWWQTSAETWRIDAAVTRTQFTDPEPYLNRGELDFSDTAANLEFAYGTYATYQKGWGIRPRIGFIDSSQYGSKSRFDMDILHSWQIDGENLSQQIDLGVTTSSDFDPSPLARYGISHQTSKQTGVYAAAGYAVRFPAFSELYLTDMGSIQGNPDLEAEKVINYEAGFSWRGKQTLIDLTAFHSDYRDTIIFAPVSAYLVRAENTGPASVTGAEALLDHHVGSGWWWRTAYTWLPRARYKSGIPLSGRAEHHANSRLEYAGDMWTGAISLDHTGEIPADLFGSLIIAERTLVGVELARRLGNGEFGISATNLLDESARDAWNYPLPGREIYIKWRMDL